MNLIPFLFLYIFLLLKICVEKSFLEMMKRFINQKNQTSTCVLNGYIDFSHGCWIRFMLVTDLRCSLPILYIKKSPTE